MAKRAIDKIVEGNNLMAVFMKRTFMEEMLDDQMDLQGTRDMRFHSSWDWLMPVVERIQELTFIDSSKHPIVIIYNNHASISIGNPGYHKNTKDAGYYYAKTYGVDTPLNKIEATWSVIVHFLQWFEIHGNEQILPKGEEELPF